MNYYQHGDVLLFEDTFPKSAKTQKTNIFYKGMNHEHKVRGKFRILKTKENTYIESKGCYVFHDEHEEIKLPKGVFRLQIVKEYDHLLEESRQVID